MFTSVIKMKTKVKTFVSTIFLFVFKPFQLTGKWPKLQIIQFMQTTKHLTSKKKRFIFALDRSALEWPKRLL